MADESAESDGVHVAIKMWRLHTGGNTLDFGVGKLYGSVVEREHAVKGFSDRFNLFHPRELAIYRQCNDGHVLPEDGQSTEEPSQDSRRHMIAIGNIN